MRWTLSFHWTDLYLAFTQALCFACCNHIKNSKSTFHQYILKESKPAVPKLIPTKNKVKRSVASWAKGTDVGLVRDRRCSWVRPLLSSCNPLLPLKSCKLLNLFFPEKVSLVLPSRVVNVEHFGASAVHPPCNRSLVFFLLLRKLLAENVLPRTQPLWINHRHNIFYWVTTKTKKSCKIHKFSAIFESFYCKIPPPPLLLVTSVVGVAMLS